MEKKPTKAELDILRMIVAHHIEHGKYPRNKDLVEKLNVSKAKISGDISALERHGFITRLEHIIIHDDREKILKALREDMSERLNETLSIMDGFGIARMDSKGNVYIKRDRYKDYFPGKDPTKTVNDGDLKYKIEPMQPQKQPTPPREKVEPKKKETRLDRLKKMFGGGA